MSKIPQRSANDEKWCDYFLIVVIIKTSASGEVEENQKMAEKYKLEFYSFLEFDQFQI